MDKEICGKLICYNQIHYDLVALIESVLCYDQDYIGSVVKNFYRHNKKALYGTVDPEIKKEEGAKMPFNFEEYWKKHGVHTDPPIIGIAFKNYAQMAVDAVLKTINPEKIILKEDDCSSCYGCGNVMISHITQCSTCGGTGKKPKGDLNGHQQNFTTSTSRD